MSMRGEIENVEREIAQYKIQLQSLEKGKKSPGDADDYKYYTKGWLEIRLREMIEESEARLERLQSV